MASSARAPGALAYARGRIHTQGVGSRQSLVRRTSGVKLVALAVSIAAFSAPAAHAKGPISVGLGDSTPRVGQVFTVYVKTGYTVPVDDWIRLIAVAPRKDWYDVIGTVTGDSVIAHANIPHDGFEVKLVRVGPRNWRAAVRLPRPGRWRLVIPNGTHTGFMLPPPTSWMPWVDVHQ